MTGPSHVDATIIVDVMIMMALEFLVYPNYHKIDTDDGRSMTSWLWCVTNRRQSYKQQPSRQEARL
jgi:hypothetical protein